MYFGKYGQLFKEDAMIPGNPVCILTILVIGMVFIGGCTDTGSGDTGANFTPQIVNETIATVPATLTPAVSPDTTYVAGPVTSQTLAPKDPIIGSWLNGMVFNADGTVGSDGTAVWKVNQNENNSYFVITDVPSEGANNPRTVTSSEWMYNPYSDKINMRGSSQTFARGVKVTKPTTKPTATAMQTPAVALPSDFDDSPGTLSIHTGGLGGEGYVFVAREGTSVQSIESVYDSAGNIVDSQAAGYLRVKIMPDGDSGRVSLAPGSYTAYLPPKYRNGGDTEQKTFTINSNANTVITFSGFSYRAGIASGCGG